MTVVTRPWTSVVIPIKDERDNLVPLTEQLVKVLESRDESQSAPFELLFVDDGSTDGSSELLDSLAAQYRSVRVLHFDRNYGQSAAFDAGFKQSTGELVHAPWTVTSRTTRRISTRLLPIDGRSTSSADGAKTATTI